MSWYILKRSNLMQSYTVEKVTTCGLRIWKEKSMWHTTSRQASTQPQNILLLLITFLRLHWICSRAFEQQQCFERFQPALSQFVNHLCGQLGTETKMSTSWWFLSNLAQQIKLFLCLKFDKRRHMEKIYYMNHWGFFFNSKRLYSVPGKIDNVKCEYLIEVVRPVEYVEEGKEEGK